MRKRIWITCTVILVVCLLLLLIKSTQHQKTAPFLEQSETLTNQPSQPEESKPVEYHQTTNTARMAATLPPMTPLAEAVATTNPVDALRLAAWQTPIEFYGKVIDDNSNAVAGATIGFHWVEIPTEEGNRTTNAESDAEGLFSLHGQRGPTLSVSVSKEGYYATRGGVKYGPFGNPDFSPDPQNPVVFYLRKKGMPAEVLVPMKRNYRIPRDGTPVSIDLVTGATTTGENGNLVVRCWTNDQGKRSGDKYDWRCVIAIPGGGLVLSDEKFPFLAPENGYALTNQILIPADRPHWTSDVSLNFYYRLADGRYGRMKFSMIAGGQHFCMIESVLNPSGSRNLEPAN